MKKCFLSLITSILFINTVNANTLESDLKQLKNQYIELKEKVNSFDETILNKTYPIGSIFETTTYSTVAQVSNALGGTWEVYGSGKTLVGVDSSDSDFNTVNKTGGSKTTTLTVANLPSHTHSIPALTGTTDSNGSHSHNIPKLTGIAETAGAHTHTRGTMDIIGSISSLGNGEPKFGTPSGAFGTNVRTDYYSRTTNVNLSSGSYRYDGFNFKASRNWTGATSSDGNHTHSITINESNTEESGLHSHIFTTEKSTSGSQGSGTAFTNLQPYITVYMYKRVG